MAPPSLRLRTFGGLAVERDGVPLVGIAARRRPLVLLAFVASHGSVGVSRDAACALLWPDSDEERARNSLKQAVFALRRERNGLFLDSYVVRPLDLPPYRGAVGGTLPVYAVHYLDELRQGGAEPGLDYGHRLHCDDDREARTGTQGSRATRHKLDEGSVLRARLCISRHVCSI